MMQTIGTRFVHPQLRMTIENVCRTCNPCQRNSLLSPAYGHLPAQVADSLPWQEVAVDLIGPWTVNFQDESYAFNALTCVDIATGYPEAI